jgi:integrase
MPNGTISKRTVDAANPGPRDWFLWDDDLPGFGLKITPAGGKVYVFQYRLARPGEAERTAAKRYTIGKHGKFTPDQARRRAKDLAALVLQGIDPRQQELDAIAAKVAAADAEAERARLEGELLFEKVAERWLEHYEHEKGRRPSSVRHATQIVKSHLEPALAGKALPHITRADLQAIIDGIPVKHRAVRRGVHAYANILFGWAIKRGDITDNPLATMAKPEPPKARDRVLSDNELAAVWKASHEMGEPFGAFFRLLILTGQRRSEVAGMDWAELDRSTATWTIPAGRAKNGIAHIVPLSAPAIAELDALALAAQIRAEVDDPDKKHWPKAGYAMPTTRKTPITGFTKPKAALDAGIAKAHDGRPLPGWRIHDLRRTLATGFQRLGVRFEVTEAVLNHVSGAKAGVAGIYQRHDWQAEKKAALDSWAAHIKALVTKKTKDSKVVPIRAAS